MINLLPPETQKVVTNPHLKTLLTDIAAINEEVSQLLSHYSAEQLTWKPTPTEWSMAECFDHLMVFGHQYYPKVQQTIDQTRQKNLRESRPFRPSWLIKMFVNTQKPSSGWKTKTFKNFEPAQSPDDSTGQRLLEQQKTLVDLIRQADGYDLNRLKLTSPVTWLLKFSVGEALWMLVVHQQLHLHQAKAVAQLAKFPTH